jgi:hypothetical protein
LLKILAELDCLHRWKSRLQLLDRVATGRGPPTAVDLTFWSSQGCYPFCGAQLQFSIEFGKNFQSGQKAATVCQSLDVEAPNEVHVTGATARKLRVVAVGQTVQ